MKFKVTAVPMSKKTRRRIGKATVEVIDTDTTPFFVAHNANWPRVNFTDAEFWTPFRVEHVFEAMFDTNPMMLVKVIDVREVKP